MKHNNVLVSIVIPVYNVIRYLDDCLNSVVNQTYSNLEIILVDDGSKDGSSKLCDKWASIDNRIKVIHKTNAGLGEARNTGIENANGEYICFLDSDDFLDSNTIECSLDTNYEIIYYGFKSVDENGKIINRKIPSPLKTVYNGDDIYTEFLPNFITDLPNNKPMNLNASSCMCLISKKVIDKFNWRFVSERKIISEDIYSMMVLFKSIKHVKIIEKDFYSYRENNNSLTRTFREDRFDKNKELYYELDKIYPNINSINFRLKYMFISYTIAYIKQLVNSNLKFKEKRKIIRRVSNDNEFKIISKEIIKIDSLKRKVFLILLRNKLIVLVYIMAVLQNKKRV